MCAPRSNPVAESVDLLDEIDGRIASRVLRSELVAAARDVADADGERTASEDRVIAKVINRFG